MNPRGRQPRLGGIALAIGAFLLFVGGRSIAGWTIDYQWWKELGQLETWFSLMAYSFVPTIAAGLLAFVLLWVAHARGLKAAGTRLSDHRTYGKWISWALLAAGLVLAAMFVDSWVVMRYAGGHGLAGDGWRDPAFGKPLAFYLFDLPLYSMLLRYVLALCVAGGVAYYLTTRGWKVSRALPSAGELELNLSWSDFAMLEGRFLRALAAVFLIAFALQTLLDRYELVYGDHGFMAGADWVAARVTVPLLWLTAAGCVFGAAALIAGWWRLAAVFVLVPFAAKAVLPGAVGALHVRPNELAIQRDYIKRHIEATREAYGLNARTTEREYAARIEGKIDVAANKALLDNVRLWDWRAFHDTLSQIQPLRPYVFSDTDVDRYRIDGGVRQVMISPRELDLGQLGDQQAGWTNLHLIYTHGYGLVMAESNRITPDGRPVLFIENAPPAVHTPSLKVTRPELYYGEKVDDPVFVRTAQPEFNYPSGAENQHTRYDGKGGFEIGSLPVRMAAALVYGDANILLTNQLGAGSRMMIRRGITQRISHLANFIDWDDDPYLVLRADGRIAWVIDGYLSSDAHPYSRHLEVSGIGRLNYMRNSVKAVVDAYDGSVSFYVFETNDPLIRAWRNLFPRLFLDANQMPADLREHLRYPETLFRVQAEIYRTYHMRDPDAFYNKADLWDIARGSVSQEGSANTLKPTYVTAELPGESAPEFLLMLPFTPRNKDNLIGMMAARCDGAHLGELVFLQMSKQEPLLGPMQVEARMNQDQNISKDLTLWNQQGSGVLRGQMQVLPVDNTFLYVAPIYIQAREARMPQMKKVVLGLGNSLIYADTYDQALEQLAAQMGGAGAAKPASSAAAATPAAQPANGALGAVRDHLRRYREFAAQGKWADAGRELEAIEALVR